MALCEECTEASNAWLDYRLPPAPIQLCTVGRNSVRAVEEGRKMRVQEWRDTITRQQKIIKGICERKHQ